MKRLLSVIMLTVSLSACASLPVDAERSENGEYVLTYHKRALDNLYHMRQELMLKAQEVCVGAYSRLKEYPDPEGLLVVPSMELNWQIKCLEQ